MQPGQQLLLTLGVGFLLILSNRVRPDLVALLVMLALPLGGLITTEQALAGFSRPAVIALAGLFVITRALDANGVIQWLGEQLERVGGRSEARLVGVFMLAGAALSMVMNNLAAGSVLLPAALAACRRSHVAPSRLLLPLSYGILLGGMSTLFTTANLVLGGVLDTYQLAPLTMVDFMLTGGCALLVGLVFMVTVGRHMLPQREVSPAPVSSNLVDTYRLLENLREARLADDSPLVGQTLLQSQIGGRYGVSVLAIERGHDQHFDPSPAETLLAGDVLLLLGSPERAHLLEAEGAVVSRPSRSSQDLPVKLTEAIVSPRSRAIGQDLTRLRMRHRYGVTIVGLWRRGRSHLTDVSRYKLEAGDALLMLGPAERVAAMSHSVDFLIPDLPPLLPSSPTKALLTLVVAAISMAVAAEGLLPLALAMLVGGAVLVCARCLTMEQAYEGIEWNVIVLIAAMAPVGTALASTGLAQQMAQSLEGLVRYGPHVFEMANYLLAVLVTQVIGGQVASLVIGPVSVAAAIHLQSLGVSPHAVGLLVALGCSTAFLTPVAHPVNVLMMGPGGYQARDFAKVGLPLTLLVTLTVAALVWWSPFLSSLALVQGPTPN